MTQMQILKRVKHWQAQDSEPEARGLFKGNKGVKHLGNGAKNVKSGLQAIKGDLKNAGKGKRVSKKTKDDADIKAHETVPRFRLGLGRHSLVTISLNSYCNLTSRTRMKNSLDGNIWLSFKLSGDDLHKVD